MVFVTSFSSVRLVYDIYLISMSYFQFRDIVVVRLVYDGRKLGLFISFEDPTRPGKQLVKPFSGTVLLHAVLCSDQL